MRIAAALFAATALAACATAPADAASGGPVTGAAPGDANCDVTIVFGSYAMGIDGDTHAKVTAYLERHTDTVADSTVTRWGREGEQTVCVKAKSDSATRKIYADLKAMVPATARGPVELRNRFGDSVRSEPPAGM